MPNSSHLDKQLARLLDDIAEAIAPGGSVTAVSRLTGGVSAETFALDAVTVGGEDRRWVVRRLSADSSHRSLSPIGEYALLNELTNSGVPIARPLLFVPPRTIVMEWVEGTNELPADGPASMGDALTRIHSTRGELQLPLREDPLPFVAQVLGVTPAEIAPRGAPAAPTLLHGDFWPGNLLWRNGELVAVLDWEDAAMGDPTSDVACARVELAVAAGERAADVFTRRYGAQVELDPARLAVWDVYVSISALEAMDSWGLPADALRHRRSTTEAFRDDAIARLAAARG